MKKSSRKGRTFQSRVPLADAAEIVGGMARLEALAGNDNTWRTWKNTWRAVPAYKLTPVLLEWWTARKDLITKARQAEYERVMALLREGRPPEQQSAVQG